MERSLLNNSQLVMELKGRIVEMDRKFDVEFWQRQGSEAIFAAAWQMVIDSFELKGKHAAELEFQRSVEAFRRKRS
jgi:hypothetical protein